MSSKFKITYRFKIYLEETEVCRIDLEENLFEKKATLEIYKEEDIPIEIKILNRSTNPDKTEALIYFLKDRVLPSNRMLIDEELRKYNVSVDDWIGKMELNQGRSYEDEYWVAIEKIKPTEPSGPSEPSEQEEGIV